MIARPKGATLSGFISKVGKNYGVKIESVKNDAGDRVYTIGK
jgi:hypothetical protein